MAQQSNSKYSLTLFAFKLALTVSLLLFVVTHVDLSDVWQRIASMDVTVFFAALMCIAGGYVFCGLRWAWIAQGMGMKVSKREKVRLYFLGMFASLFLPSTIGGDVIRGVLMARGEDRKNFRLHAAASVILDRVNGLYALVLLLTVCLMMFDWSLALWLGWSILLLTMWGGMLIYPWLHTRLPGWLGALKRLPLNTPLFYRMWWRSLPVSLLFQLLVVQAHWLLGTSVGLDMAWSAYAVMVGLVALVAILPISLNGFGVREAGYVGFAVFFQGDPEAATAMATLWLMVLAVSALPGAWVLWSLGGVKALKKEARDSSGNT
jgi:uncharacterized membrane protein YbhN (UPF0104 family)